MRMKPVLTLDDAKKLMAAAEEEAGRNGWEVVIAREGATVTPEHLKAYCLDKGPAYSHPRFVDIVAALPLNGAGKIDRNVVQARLGAAYRATGYADGMKT